MLTKKQYNAYKAGFTQANFSASYALRNLSVLDDEQTRITDAYADLGSNLQAFAADLGVPADVAQLVLDAAKAGSRRLDLVDAAIAALLHYAGNADLFRQADTDYADVLLTDTYADYKDAAQDN